MKCFFDNIDEFFTVKEQCAFCKSKLKTQFRNFSMMHDDIPVVVAEEKDGKFCFSMSYISHSITVDADVEIITKDNFINLYVPSKEKLDPKVKDYWVVKQVFENFGPHIELYCANKKCKRKYCIASDVFKCDVSVPESNQSKLSNPRLYMESFVVDKHWVQNDFIFKSTNIYSKDDPDLPPIRAKLLDLETMDEEKILTRVRTLVTFS